MSTLSEALSKGIIINKKKGSVEIYYKYKLYKVPIYLFGDILAKYKILKEYGKLKGENKK